MRKPTDSAYRPLAFSLAKMPSAVAICAALAIASASTAGAATYYWDSDSNASGNDILTGVGLGGVGTWTTPASWFDPTAPLGNITWPNTNPSADTAVFAGTGADVTLGGGVFVNALQFNTGGYTIKNGGVAANTLTLSGTGPTINVANSGDSAVIDALIAGSQGLIKTGAGTLTLNLTGNTFTGDVLVQGGTLAFRGVAGSNDQTAFGPGAKKIILTNNATLALIGSANADPNVAGGKGFVIGTGGGTIDVASGLTFYLNDGVSNASAQNQLQGTGTLTKAGAGVLNVGRDFASTFTGDVVLKQGRIDVTVPNALGNVGTITVDGTAGPARLNYTSTTSMAFSNDIILQNGGVLSIQGNSHNLPNNKTITVGPSTAGAARIRVDDASAETPSGTGRTFVLNGALKGSNTLEITGSTAATRTAFAISNAASDFSGTIVIDKNVSVENFARWNGTTATNTGKTLGTATIKFQAIAGGSGSANDGQLDLRDSGTGNNQVFTYSNNVDMTSTGGTIMVGTNTQAAVASTGGRFVLGSLALGADNTLTVNTANGYSLEFGGVTTFGGNATITNAANLTLTGGITGGANFTKNGAGLLSIGAPIGVTYSGTTTITGGGVIFNGLNSLGGTGTSITLGNNTLLGANFVATQANLIDRIVKNSNTSVIALGQDTSADLNLTGLPKARLGAVGTATYSGTLSQDATSNTTYLGGGGGTLIFTKANVVSGTRNLDVGTYGSAAGVVALDQPQNFTGSITLGEGQLLRIGSNASLGDAANVITANGGGIQFKDAAAGYDIFATRTINFTGGFILDTNGYNYTPSVAIGGNAGNSGTGNFTKAGAGKLTLNSAVRYNGKTIITGGTLSIAADEILGAAPGADTADQLQIQSGGTLEVTSSFQIPVQRGIQFSNGGGSINVTDGNTLTLASKTSGNGQLTKEGTGTLLITADPNNMGGFTINGGVLELQHSGSTDGNFVVNDSGTLRVSTGGALGDNYSVTVATRGTFDLRGSDQISQLLGTGTVLNDGGGSATLTVSSGTNATFNGSIQNGFGTLGFTKSGANVVTLTGTNTYGGTTTINNGALVISGPAGSIALSPTVNVGDNNGGGESLTVGAVDDVVSGPLDRLADFATLVLNGSSTGGFTYNGPKVGSEGNEEFIGKLTAAAGRNSFTLNAGTGNSVHMTGGSFSRTNAGTILFRGNNLGGTGVGATRLVFFDTTGLSLTGAGGADGSTTKSIIPFAIGDNSAIGAGSGFVTYDDVNGVRLLTAAEYDSSIAGTAPLRNVSTAGGETVSSDVRINSLRLTGTAATTIAAGTRLSVNSGAVLFTDGSTIGGAGTLEFGASEGIIQLAKNTTGVTAAIDARISGTGGLTLGRSSDVTTGVITLGGDNTTVGNLTVNQGTVNLTSSTALNDNVPMTVILRPNTALGLNGNNVTIRDLQGSTGTGTFQNNSNTTAATLTTYLTADRSLQTILQNGGTAALNLVVSSNNNRLLIDQDASATGTFEQRVGVTQLSGGSGTLNDFASYAINGGTLRLANAQNSSNTNRLRDTSPIAFNGGTLDFDMNSPASTSPAETVGAVTLSSGANTITVDKAASGQTGVLTLSSLARNPGATLNLNSQTGTSPDFTLGTTTQSRLVINGTVPNDDGILGGWATIDSSATTREFVKYVSSGTISATALTASDYTTTLATGANGTKNVKITASPAALTGNTQINSLNLEQASASTIDIGANNTLRVESGGIIVSGAFDASFNNGTLTAGNGAAAGGDLVFHTLPTPASTGLTWTNADDTISLAGVSNGRRIVFSTAPGGLTAGATYYAVNATGTTFQVAATPGGAPVAITNDGTTAALTQQFPTTVNSVVADNGSNVVNLVKAGGGMLVLSGTNTYTGKTYVNGGTLRIDSDSNLGGGIGSFVADKITLSNDATLEVGSTMTLDGNRGITVGAGTNIISIPSGTAGNGKTLTYNGAITSLGTTEGSLQFKSNVASTVGVDPGKFVGNLTALNVNGTFRLDAGTVTVSNASNTIGRGLQIGMNGSGSLTYSTTGGSLTVGKGINDVLEIGVVTTDIAPALTLQSVGTLDVSALSSFTANVDTVRLGIGSGNQIGRGVLKLATNNDITAGTSIVVGNSTGQGQETGVNSVAFGSGINNVTTKSFTLGGLKSNASATVAAGGVVNLGGFGANTLDLYIARNNGSTGTTDTGNFNMTGGTLNASLNNLVIGEKTGGGAGAANGTLTVTGNNNSIVANTLTIGNLNGDNAAGSAVTKGTLDFGGGKFVVNNDVSLALWVNNSVGTQTSTGTLNITGGTFTIGGNITTSDSSSATSTVNLNGGTLDMTGGSINVDAFNAQTGVLGNVAEIYNGDGATPAPLTKTGAGTLEIRGANTYTGGTVVNGGTLLLNGSLNGTLATATGTTLAGSGSINGGVTLGDNSTLHIDLDGLATGTGYDQLRMASTTGSVSLGTNVTLSLSLGFTPNTTVDTFYYILTRADNGTSYGNLFAGLAEGATIDLGNGFIGKLTYKANWTGNAATSSFTGGNDIAIAIPEPGSVTTLVGGVGALLGLGRFRRRQARA